MKRLHVKQYELAERLGINEGTVCRYLRKPLAMGAVLDYLSHIYWIAEEKLDGNGYNGETELMTRLLDSARMSLSPRSVSPR